MKIPAENTGLVFVEAPPPTPQPKFFGGLAVGVAFGFVFWGVVALIWWLAR